MIINLGQRGYIVFCFISILDNMDMNWFMIIRIKHESESENINIVGIVSFFAKIRFSSERCKEFLENV